MTVPNEPAQNQFPAGQSPMPPTAQFSQVPAGQFPPAPAGQSPLPPNQFPPSPTPKKRASWLLPTLIGIGAVVVLCCGSAVVVSLTADDNKVDAAAVSSGAPAATNSVAASAAPLADEAVAPTPAKTSAAPAETKPKAAGIGDKVRGGDFEFTVKSVKCGIAKVGSEFLNTKAQGTFCRVSVTVKNVTKKAHSFHADGSISAQDGSGRKYEVDGEAGIYGNDDGQGFLDEINPGNSVTANVFFDVPKGTKLKTITLDAGLFTLAEDAVVTL
ncbi:hypothetical protein IW249_003114 [Micromonospora vinacea]|uniref:DUF4352 domain-containing protein n=1 Tax=Micromonospora vinacea TaxID=709878 RepID=A0ABS0K2D9_9ACTN|nr:DUF4352 domain-containing protein [Micromonospora vinacea]MBG6102700.1 hypothetical protein [Micromonospora vinacea]WTA68997.1 DUF4352 domain-containing protein [Micromonospora sp. NBC_00855]